MSKSGYVYVLTNPAMPGLVKIGHSVIGAKTRASQIYQTGVPLPFDIAFEILVPDSRETEQLVHEALQKERVNRDREFFECDVYHAIKSVISIYLRDLTLEVVGAEEHGAVHDIGYLASKTDIPWYEAYSSIGYMTADELIELNRRRLAAIDECYVAKRQFNRGEKSAVLSMIENKAAERDR